MKKDIDIPVVEDVFVAVVLEENEAFRSMDWNAYLVNDRNVPLEMVLIVTRGYDQKDTTSTMRHQLEELPAKAYAKIEFLQEEVLRLNNEFSVSYFVDSRMYHKTFVFPKGTITEEDMEEIPQLERKGIVQK